MKFIIMKIMMLFSLMTPIFKNPMSMGMLLLVQTIMMILLMNSMLSSSWFAMISFMMMIGGLLIMLMYMSSIASNEKFKTKINLTLLTILVIMMFDEMMISIQMNEDQKIELTNNLEISLMKIYNEKSMMLTILLVMYLLLTMISVTKMVKHHKGPLRAMN